MGLTAQENEGRYGDVENCLTLSSMTDTPKGLSAVHIHRHYSKAPIKEAIVDFQIDPPSGLTVERLENITAFRTLGYTESRKLFIGRVEGKLEAGQLTAKAEQGQTGTQFFGADGKHVVQLRVNGFTFSRLAPYQSWEQVRDEAKKLWAIYRDVVGSAPVRRVGLRYVNQLDLPSTLRDFRDYIRTYPEISTELHQQLLTFVMQVIIPQPDIGGMLILNEALVPPSTPDLASVVLDIDLYKEGLQSLPDEEIWNVLEVLRVRKNVVFEGCITNSTRELII
jgi:uncharacterized protein (TIGR04255 family)